MSVTTTGRDPERALRSPRVPAPGAHRRLPRWLPWAAFAAIVAGSGLLSALTGLPSALLALGAVVVFVGLVYGGSRAVEGARRATDRLVAIAVTAAFLLALVPLVSVLVTVVSRGLDRFDLRLFTHSMWGVISTGGGVYHAIVGTLVITAVTTVMAVPVGILAAIYLVEYGGRGRLARGLTFFVDVMTGIPSIVAGLFAYAMFALVFGPGVELGVVGAVALFVLMVPVVVRSTEEALKVVPADLREASYALGVPKWRTVLRVVLPTSVAGIATGVMLAVARIIGETAPLLITVGVLDSTNVNPLSGSMMTLPVFAYSQYQNQGVPNDPYLDRAWAAALLLIIIVMLLSLAARLVARVFAPKFRG